MWSLSPARATRRCRRSLWIFRISESCLHRWLKLADIDDGVRPGLTSQKASEIRELKRRNRVLAQEHEILPRAAAFFAQEALPK